MPVNVAFIGESKSGKSTVINSLRNLYPGDDGTAGVDVEVCTLKPNPYPHRQNNYGALSASSTTRI